MKSWISHTIGEFFLFKTFLQYIQPQDHEKLSQVELLVVDEAAAIPLPVVKSLLGPYLVFLSSTVNGYEFFFYFLLLVYLLKFYIRMKLFFFIVKCLCSYQSLEFLYQTNMATIFCYGLFIGCYDQTC